MSKREIEAFGETKSLSAWARDARCNISYSGLKSRINKGWRVEDAISSSKSLPPGRKPGFTAHNLNKSNFNLNINELEGKTISEVVSNVGCSDTTARRAFRKNGLTPAKGRRTGRPAKLYCFNGINKSAPEWGASGVCPVKYSTLKDRLTDGWEFETAFTKKISEQTSQTEDELAEWVKSFDIKVIRNDREILSGKELDIVIPSLNLAIEYNGLYWHSELFKSKNYHKQKLDLCLKNNLNLIQIWEDDWRDKQNIIKLLLQHRLNKSMQTRVYARNTNCDFVSGKELKNFLNMNHIQGFTGGSVSLGLRDKQGSLVAACSLLRCNDNDACWNLVRYATSCNVVGGFSKILNKFSENFNGNIKTFADVTLFTGEMYEKAGWDFVRFIPPDYMYVVNGKRYHKFNYRKAKFSKDPSLKYEDGLTEHQLATLNNIFRIYDAGKKKFIYRK